MPTAQQHPKKNNQKKQPLVWIIDSHYTGELNARIGLAERLGYPYEIIPLPNGDHQAYQHMLKQRYAQNTNGSKPKLLIISGTGEETTAEIADLKFIFEDRLLNVFLASILPDEPHPRLYEYDLIASPQLTNANSPHPTPNAVELGQEPSPPTGLAPLASLSPQAGGGRGVGGGGLMMPQDLNSTALHPSPPSAWLRTGSPEGEGVLCSTSVAPCIVPLVGVPHKLTHSTLALAYRQHEEFYSKLPKPIIGLLIGGNTRYCDGFNDAHASGLAKRVSSIVTSLEGCLVVSNSRRTPPSAMTALLGNLNGITHYFFDWRQVEESFYHSVLAHADLLIVTGDSLSMCSEAAYTGKPLLVDLSDEATECYHQEIVGKLIDHGAAKLLTGQYEPWLCVPMDPTGVVAEAIRVQLREWLYA